MAPPSGQGGHGMRGLWGLLLLTLTPLLATARGEATAACSTDKFFVNPSDGLIAACAFARLPPEVAASNFDITTLSRNPQKPNIKMDTHHYLLFKFGLNNTLIELTVEDDGMLTVVVQGVPHLLETVLLTHKWTRLCLAYNHLESEVTVYIKDRRIEVFSVEINLSSDNSINNDYDTKPSVAEEDQSPDEKVAIFSICARETSVHETTMPHLALFSVAVYPDSSALITCEESPSGRIIFSTESHASDQTTDNYGYCKEQFSIVFVNTPLTQKQLVKQCQSMSGTVLSEDDLTMYADDINYIRSDCFTDLNIRSWLHSSDDELVQFNSWCFVLLTDGSIEKRPCYFSLHCGLCKVRTGMSIRLYGDTIKYDLNYILMNNKDGSYFLKGQETSLVQLVGSNWVLQSNLHEKNCFTNQSGTPFVRLMWTCEDGQRNLTLSTCPLDGFACTSGMCIAEELRCDGVVHCDDSSDEENCRRIIKDPGYDISILPPAETGDTHVFVTYLLYVYSIGDIKTANGYADVDLVIGMRWKDSRLTVWDPSNNGPVDCSNIWAPKFLAADTWPTGHYVGIPDRFTSVCLMKMDGKMEAIKSDLDPYMSKYLPGSEVSFVFSMNGVFRVPCRFKLQKYPFGNQKCELNVWINTVEADVVRFQPNTDIHKGNDVPFVGRYDVGEYDVINTQKEEKNGNRSVSLIINLRSLYGYHVQNSYLTSTLIIFISYSTFCFRTTDFSERVSVSLTALLVMMVLFQQAQSTSIQTPYLKLLDIWYAAIIGFSFMVVLANTGLYVCQNRLEEAFNASGKHDEVAIQKRMDRYNCATVSGLLGIFVIFIFFYMLAVVDIL